MFAPSFKIEVTFAATALPFLAIPGPGPGRLPSALVDDARLRHRDDDDAHTHTHTREQTHTMNAIWKESRNTPNTETAAMQTQTDAHTQVS